MYSFISGLLSDKKGGAVFTCFGIYHLCYVVLIAVIITLALLYLKNKEKEKWQKLANIFLYISFGIYMAGFFLMPFAYGEIDIEKLPFHICTAICVLCFLSNHNAFLKKFRWNFALLGFISNLGYLLYPAGVMWYQVHPLSYRVIETLLFHGFMVVYGLLTLISEKELASKWKTRYYDLVIISILVVWAIIGNVCYNANVGNYSHFFNWFFVVRDPFYILPEKIAPFVMPFVNIFLFFLVENLVCFILHTTNKKK